MPELNHEIDRDNLNKVAEQMERDMAKLLFPSGRNRYVEELNEKIGLMGCIAPGTEVEAPHAPVFWDTGRALHMTFERIT